jgi:hypothetical protein
MLARRSVIVDDSPLLVLSSSGKELAVDAERYASNVQVPSFSGRFIK